MPTKHHAVTRSPALYLDTVQAYIDTFGIYRRQKLPEGLLSALRREYRKRLIVDKKGKWGWMYTIHQPALHTLQFFANHNLSSFHIAYDFHDHDLKQFLIQKRRRRQRSNVFENTTYGSSNKKEPRNTAAYSDRVSKITGEDVDHIELRFTGAACCQRTKVRSVGDLLELDISSLLANQIMFRKIVPEQLEHAITVLASKSLIRLKRTKLSLQQMTARYRETLLRALRDDESVTELTQLRSQQLWDFHRSFKACCQPVELEVPTMFGRSNSLMISMVPEQSDNSTSRPQGDEYAEAETYTRTSDQGMETQAAKGTPEILPG